MTYTSDDEIEAVARAMAACTLPKAEWTHGAHFGAALWLLRTRGDAAYADMPGMIRAYNKSVGGRNTDTEGYHETITQASLRMAARALRDAPLHVVLDELMAGPCGQSGWIFAYWTKEVLMSPEARRAWIEPDLQTLPA